MSRSILPTAFSVKYNFIGEEGADSDISTISVSLYGFEIFSIFFLIFLAR